jgi:predicted amidophosphoribosyltransferase
MICTSIIAAIAVLLILRYIYVEKIAAMWQAKAAAAYFVVGQRAKAKDECEWGYRNALLAGNEKAEKFYFYSALERFNEERPLTIFYRKLCGKEVPYIFVNYYIPSRDHIYTSLSQQQFCRRIYKFKDGKDCCIDLFLLALENLEEAKSATIIFMPCRSDEAYSERFAELARRLTKSGYHALLDSMTYLYARQSKHLAADRNSVKASGNIVIHPDIVGRKAILIDDVITTGESIRQHAEELRPYGVDIVGVVCLGFTVQMADHERILKQARRDNK